MGVPKLVPLKVAWEVSPSTPYLRLVAVENAAQGDTYVEFVAFYGLEQDTSAASPGSVVRVVGPPPDFESRSNSVSGPYRLLRLLFKLAIAARMCPAYADSQVIDESRYDWSDIPDDYEPGEQLGNYLARYREQWRRGGVCPDPGVYQVNGSRWIEELELLNEPIRWKHYIVLGHDCYVEVIAKELVVEEGQPLSGW